MSSNSYEISLADAHDLSRQYQLQSTRLESPIDAKLTIDDDDDDDESRVLSVGNIPIANIDLHKVKSQMVSQSKGKGKAAEILSTAETRRWLFDELLKSMSQGRQTPQGKEAHDKFIQDFDSTDSFRPSITFDSDDTKDIVMPLIREESWLIRSSIAAMRYLASIQHAGADDELRSEVLMVDTRALMSRYFKAQTDVMHKKVRIPEIQENMKGENDEDILVSAEEEVARIYNTINKQRWAMVALENSRGGWTLQHKFASEDNSNDLPPDLSEEDAQVISLAQEMESEERIIVFLNSIIKEYSRAHARGIGGPSNSMKIVETENSLDNWAVPTQVIQRHVQTPNPPPSTQSHELSESRSTEQAAPTPTTQAQSPLKGVSKLKARFNKPKKEDKCDVI